MAGTEEQNPNSSTAGGFLGAIKKLWANLMAFFRRRTTSDVPNHTDSVGALQNNRSTRKAGMAIAGDDELSSKVSVELGSDFQEFYDQIKEVKGAFENAEERTYDKEKFDKIVGEFEVYLQGKETRYNSVKENMGSDYLSTVKDQISKNPTYKALLNWKEQCKQSEAPTVISEGKEPQSTRRGFLYALRNPKQTYRQHKANEQRKEAEKEKAEENAVKYLGKAEDSLGDVKQGVAQAQANNQRMRRRLTTHP